MLYSVKDALNYFTSRCWEFKNDNALELWHLMTKEDQQMYNFNLTTDDAFKHTARCVLGMRYFFLKEPMESIPAAKRKRKWYV